MYAYKNNCKINTLYCLSLNLFHYSTRNLFSKGLSNIVNGQGGPEQSKVMFCFAVSLYWMKVSLKASSHLNWVFDNKLLYWEMCSLKIILRCFWFSLCHVYLCVKDVHCWKLKMMNRRCWPLHCKHLRHLSAAKNCRHTRSTTTQE